MLENDVVQIATQALYMAGKVAAPLLVVSLVVGVAVSLVQAVFQVQDQVLAMVPRLAAGGVVLALTGTWMLREMAEWTAGLFRSIPALVG